MGIGSDKQSNGVSAAAIGADSLAGPADLSTDPSVHSADSSPEPPADPLAHIVLYQPEIPQNTGNIGRSCVAAGAHLWIVRPAAFRLDDRSLRRAGLDYWQHLVWRDVPDWTALTEQLPQQRFWYFSRFATRSYWDAPLRRGDVLVFGSETNGLPPSIHAAAGDRLLRIPTPGKSAA